MFFLSFYLSEKERKESFCLALHNVPLIKTQYGIRKLTPIECFYAQGYPKEYRLPTDMSDARLYKQAGNSVVVPVINRIAENIVKALKQD